ncbi:MAG: hypothetical protein ACREQL_03535 [Candidatus Binatia bacterium]
MVVRGHDRNVLIVAPETTSQADLPFPPRLVTDLNALRVPDQRFGPPVPEPFDVDVRRPAPEVILLDADAGAAPAMVFVSEAHHPWWRATVDGKVAPTLRAAFAFMAVAIPPGRHAVELRFERPRAVAIADRVAAVSWLVFPVLVVVWATGTRRRARYSRARTGGE